jgi:CRISPR/Cas system Type II protein with McrA/HNH and RuvC-like nuclease domain
MSLCQHDDCEREGIAAWNGCVFCDEHVRDRLRTTADEKLLARVAQLEAAISKFRRTFEQYEKREYSDAHVLRPAVDALVVVSQGGEHG